MRRAIGCEVDEKKRTISYDVLKVFSIIAVLALHTQRCVETGICYNPVLYYLARFAMPVFFMVNGALLLSKTTFTKEYYKRKVLNILRLLVSWAVIYMIYAFVCRQDSLTRIIKDGVHCLLGDYFVPLWFFITFLIIYSILLFGFEGIKSNILFILGSLFLIGIIIDSASLYIVYNHGFWIQDALPQKFRIWTWLFYFSLGWYIKDRKIQIGLKKLLPAVIISTVFAWILQYEICFVYLRKINSGYLYSNVIIVLWCTLIFILFQQVEGWMKRKAFFRWIAGLSKYSFGVLVVHMFIIDYFDLTRLPPPGGSLTATLLWIGVVVLSFAVSFVMSKIPFIKMLFTY